MQVFSVPVEEQRLKEMSEQQFGERGRVQTRICLEIMARTGTISMIWCWRICLQKIQAIVHKPIGTQAKSLHILLYGN